MCCLYIYIYSVFTVCDYVSCVVFVCCLFNWCCLFVVVFVCVFVCVYCFHMFIAFVLLFCDAYYYGLTCMILSFCCNYSVVFWCCLSCLLCLLRLFVFKYVLCVLLGLYMCIMSLLCFNIAVICYVCVLVNDLYWFYIVWF